MAHKRKIRSLKTRKPNFIDFIFLMTIGVLFSWSIVVGMLNPTIFSINYLLIFAKIFCIIGVLVPIFSSKRSLLISLCCVIVGSITAVGLFLTNNYLNIVNRISALLVGMLQFIIGQRAHTDLYEMISIWAVCIIISLFVVIFCYFRFRFLVLFTTSIIMFGMAITSHYFTDTPAFHIFIFSILVLLVRCLHQKNAQKGVDPAPFTKYVLLLIITSLLIAVILPTPQQGISQSMIRRPFDIINGMLADLTQPNEFSLQQVGFGSTGRLGGDIALNDGLFMRMRTNRTDPIYLTGAIRDTYTGYSWINNARDEDPASFDDKDMDLELIEYLLSLQLSWLKQMFEIPVQRFVLIQDREYLNEQDRLFEDPVTGMALWASYEHSWFLDLRWDLNNILNMVDIDVLDARPFSAFYPGIIYNISAQNVDDLSFLRYLERPPFAQRRMPLNTIYRISYIEPNHHFEWYSYDGISTNHRLEMAGRGLFANMSDFITTFQEFHGDSIIDMIVEYQELIISLEDLLNNYLIVRAEQIYEIYTALPTEFPNRVRELAIEITDEATSDYERMRTLEVYLSENFTYTLTPGPTPADQDFVDHFLFDIRQGYCVHFATAFVTMARSLGMPARYVEGFLVPTEFGVGRNQEGFIDVLNNMAHAWPEVYFEGVGWVRFEPTPSSGLPQAQFSFGIDRVEREDVLDDLYEENSENEESLGEQDENEDSDVLTQIDNTIDEQIEVDGILRIWSWPLSLFGVGVVFVLAIARVVFVHIKIKQAMRKENNEAVVYLFSVMLSYLKVFKIEMQKEETVQQFTNRISDEFFDDEYIQLLVKKFADVFSKARYSNLSVSDTERQIAQKVIYTMDERMKNNGRWMYFYRFYILIRH